jgi:hypothetical protein
MRHTACAKSMSAQRAVASLAGYPRLPSRNSSEWLFPGEKTNTSITSPSKAWQRIRRRAALNGDDNVANTAVRQHDLRRTLGSWLAASGYSLPLIGRALNHANVSTTAIYARLDLDPVRRALEDNATMMLAAPGKQTVDAEPKRSNSTQRRRVAAEGVDLDALVESVPGRSIRLSRDELHRRVWSNPVGSVAKELGISGRGLAKNLHSIGNSSSSARLLGQARGGQTCTRDSFTFDRL